MSDYRPQDYATPHGKLTVIFGPMFCGKTSRLLNCLAIHEGLKHKILLISHLSDDRASSGEASESGILTTHRNSPGKIDVYNECVVKSLGDVNEKFLQECDVIGIDEAQFFDDIELVTEWIFKYSSKIYTAGLLATSELKMFGNYYKLLPHADEIKSLEAVCVRCLKDLNSVGIIGILPPAKYTKCLVAKSGDVLVGSSAYVPVCRRHYYETTIETLSALQEADDECLSKTI